MKPILSRTTVARPREELYDLILDLRNHEAWTDHMLVDWSGTPERVRCRSALPGPKDWVDVETVEASRLRGWLQRGNDRAMRRLEEHAEAR